MQNLGWYLLAGGSLVALYILGLGVIDFLQTINIINQTLLNK